MARRHHRLDRSLRRNDQPRNPRHERQVSRQRSGLTDLIFCKLLQGLGSDTDTDAKRLHSELSRFAILDTGGEAIVIAAAQNDGKLRAGGITIRKTRRALNHDCLIATTCIHGNHTLLHRDRDFDPLSSTSASASSTPASESPVPPHNATPSPSPKQIPLGSARSAGAATIHPPNTIRKSPATWRNHPP